MIANKLKVYRDTYDLVKYLIPLVNKMPRIYKFTLGERIITHALDQLNHIQLANMQREKRQIHLENFMVSFEMLKAMIRISFESRAIQGLGQQAEIARRMELIGKQITAWKNTDSKRHRGVNDGSEKA